MRAAVAASADAAAVGVGGDNADGERRAECGGEFQAGGDGFERGLVRAAPVSSAWVRTRIDSIVSLHFSWLPIHSICTSAVCPIH